MSIVEIRDLSFSYRKDGEEKVVLDKLNIDIEDESFVAVIGQNGSGKSTFAKHLNAILLPMGGRVVVCGINTKNEKELFALRKNAGMVFQNPDNQIVATTVEEDVAFGLENLGIEYEEMHKRVKEALIAVNMYDLRKRAPHLLSGGQKQRVAIAGILAMEPRCIIFDEPTAMLDPVGRREVMDTIIRLNKEKHITVIMITHHMDEVVCASRVIVLNKGKIEMDASPREVFKNVEKLKELGLDAPQSVLLLHALKDAGFDVEANALTPEECAEEILACLKKREVQK
ncbi:MAG: energy-coupling factor transporter ATPase [Clostridia bacterium]|nr:energy-coupling factor transporter ATPase [Clostridia bacterium]